MRQSLLVAAGLLFAVALAGCGPAASNPPVPPPVDEHAGHDHSHGHDHATHGPNGGHLVEFGNAYHVEWLHDDAAGKVTLILLDGEMKNKVKTAADKATIHVTVGEGEPQSYDLPGVAAGEEKTFSRFELVEPVLVEALSFGEGVKAVLSLEIDGKPFSAPIGHAAGEGHDHAHQH